MIVVYGPCLTFCFQAEKPQESKLAVRPEIDIPKLKKVTRTRICIYLPLPQLLKAQVTRSFYRFTSDLDAFEVRLSRTTHTHQLPLCRLPV